MFDSREVQHDAELVQDVNVDAFEALCASLGDLLCQQLHLQYGLFYSFTWFFAIYHFMFVSSSYTTKLKISCDVS